VFGDHGTLAFVILIFAIAYLVSLKFDPVLARVLLARGGAMRVDLFLAIGFLIIAAVGVAGAWRVWRLTRPRED
jgi:hypothetical protein